MRRKGPVVADAALAQVTIWPYVVEGVLELFDCGDPDEEYEQWTPSWAIATLRPGGLSFCIPGSVLAAGSWSWRLMDTGPAVRVSIVPSEGEYALEAVGGKLVNRQLYEAVAMELLGSPA